MGRKVDDMNYSDYSVIILKKDDTEVTFMIGTTSFSLVSKGYTKIFKEIHDIKELDSIVNSYLMDGFGLVSTSRRL